MHVETKNESENEKGFMREDGEHASKEPRKSERRNRATSRDRQKNKTTAEGNRNKVKE